MLRWIMSSAAALGFAAPVFAEQPEPITADEMRAVVAEMLADAETRSSLQGARPATTGHDGKFFLTSPDGNFRMQIGGQIQTRYTLNFRDDENDTRDDFESGFTLSRAALRFDGHVFSPDLTYAVQGSFNRATGNFTLEDAYVGYRFAEGLSLYWGQYRLPILWEELLRETHSLAVDQSVVNAVFNQGRSQAVHLAYSADQWRGWWAVSDGIRSANTDIGADPADIGFTTRMEWKFFGEWEQFNAFSSPREAAGALKLGGGVHWQTGPDAPGVADTDLLAYTGDVMYEGAGWNLFVMGVGLYTDTDGVGNFHDFGFLAQGGAFVTERIELFGRYDVVIPDGDRAGGDSFNTITAGMNYYLHGHAAKFTADVQYFFDSTTGNDLVNGVATGAAGSVGNRIGLLPSGDDGQVAIRGQFQLLF